MNFTFDPNKLKKRVTLRDDDNSKLVDIYNFLFKELVWLFETFFILEKINNIPFGVFNWNEHRFLWLILKNFHDQLNLSISRILIDSKSECMNLNNFKKELMRRLDNEEKCKLKHNIKMINPKPTELKKTVLTAIRDCQLAHLIYEPKKEMPFGEGTLTWEDKKIFVIYCIELFKTFSEVLSYSSWFSCNLNYIDDFSGKSKDILHDVDLFIIDYLDRYFPEFFVINETYLDETYLPWIKQISEDDKLKIMSLRSKKEYAENHKSLFENHYKEYFKLKSLNYE